MCGVSPGNVAMISEAKGYQIFPVLRELYGKRVSEEVERHLLKVLKGEAPRPQVDWPEF